MPSTSSHKGVACLACKGPLEDAVTTCGHTFCRLCLPPPSHRGAQPSSRVLLCPLCKEKEKTEILMAPVPLGPLGETYCKEHGEKIYFFCENDAEFLCVFCREGPTHQAHTVGFLEDAIQPYRNRLRSRLEALSMERDEIEDIKSREDQKIQVLLTRIESKKQQVEAAFEKLQQELRKQHCLLLARLTELERQIWKERDEYISKVTEEVTWLGVQVKELEEKCQQPASELLQTTAEAEPSPIPVLKLFPEYTAIGGVVILDPQTASRSLVLSEDRKSIRYTRQKQNLPNSPLRFESLPAVLGSAGFSSGRHRWQVEVQLGERGGCMVGVAGEGVKKRGEQGLSTDEGVWAVIFSHQQCWASTSPGTDLPLNNIPRSMAVALDYEAGQVTLLNA
ncbi:Tripartite motif-containing protein 15 [Pteropus alecto]|uniref:Tripartite motif-containing protein 15 n=1 Tax=Pteropus alecto TaxID=9402 RepID=L5KHK2_PTEAL|nr:Tripartite motif-containing protein 15 [Pteropus alecto]